MPMGVATCITKLNEMHTKIIEQPSCISNYSWFWLSCWDPLVFLLPKTSKLFSNILLWAFLSKKRAMHTEVYCVRFHCTNEMFATDRWCLKIKKHVVMFLNVTKVRITCSKSQLYHIYSYPLTKKCNRIYCIVTMQRGWFEVRQSRRWLEILRPYQTTKVLYQIVT